ncbi:hypothetical protein GCM10018952_73440 [Streptosporangium vulgare]
MHTTPSGYTEGSGLERKESECPVMWSSPTRPPAVAGPETAVPAGDAGSAMSGAAEEKPAGKAKARTFWGDMGWAA